MNKLTILIPCLNEEKTLPLIIPKLSKIYNKLAQSYSLEIIFIDNGSTDKSLEIIKKNGFNCLSCEKKGYGAALKYGINRVNSGIIVFADADNTYDFEDVPKLIDKLINSKSDLVIGDRLNKKTKPNAMPFSHRYIGTPFLTFLINKFFSNNFNKITDCNSGYRCFYKKSYKMWNPKSDGMEFASEMLILAQKKNSKIAEVAIELHADIKERVKHLKTWKDGMRHLLIILRYSPSFFFKISIIGFLFSWTILIISYLFGAQTFVNMSIFDIHTMLFCSLATFLSSSIWGMGLILEDHQNIKKSYYKYFMSLNEDRLFFVSVVNIVIFVISLSCILLIWMKGNMIFLNLQKELILLMSLLGTGFNMNIFCINYFAPKSNKELN